MEAQQCVKLSLTNRSIGLIPPLPIRERGDTNTIASSDKLSRLAKSTAATARQGVLPKARPRKGALNKELNRPSISKTRHHFGLGQGSRPLAAFLWKATDGHIAALAKPKRLCLDDLVAMARG